MLKIIREMNSTSSKKYTPTPFRDCCWKHICGEVSDPDAIRIHLTECFNSRANEKPQNDEKKPQNDNKKTQNDDPFSTSDLTGNGIVARDYNGNVLFGITEVENKQRKNISELLILRTTPELRTDEDKTDEHPENDEPQKKSKNRRPKKVKVAKETGAEGIEKSKLEDIEESEENSSIDEITG